MYKSGANFEFLAKTGLVSGSFLKGFLYVSRFSEITSRREKSQDKRIRKPKVEKGKEMKLKRKKKQGNAISSQILRNQYASRKSQISPGSIRVGVFF